MADYIFIDFEASSLSKDSWPIEIGVCWIDEREKLRSEAKLIRPHKSWSLNAWWQASQQIHGIALEQLEEGEEATAVAHWALNRLEGAVLLSDAAEIDQRWLMRLLDTIGRADALQILSIQEEATRCFAGSAMGIFFQAMSSQVATHRAAPDALRLGQAWRAAARTKRKTRR